MVRATSETTGMTATSGITADGGPTATPHVTRLKADHEDAVCKLFSLIATDPLAKKFHPHPFTRDKARAIANYNGKDVYLGLFDNSALEGYGMLRGWDQGYDVPSLGIYLSPSARGRRWSPLLMAALHDQARALGASRVRLKVYPDNEVALRVYTRLGYRFTSEEENQLVGYVELNGGPR
jgi:ribosomal-protein-alanine N-acetyltransferase